MTATYVRNANEATRGTHNENRLVSIHTIKESLSALQFAHITSASRFEMAKLVTTVTERYTIREFKPK